MENTIRKRRLQWMGHVIRMDEARIARQVINWTPLGRRGRGRPRKKWPETIREDSKCMDTTWEMHGYNAVDREKWRSCIVQCAELHEKE